MTLLEVLIKEGIEVHRDCSWYTGKTKGGKKFFLEKDSRGNKFNLIIEGIGQKTRCNLDTVRIYLITN